MEKRMKYAIILLTLLIGCSNVYGQSISASPTSTVLWGNSTSTALIDAEYKDVSLVFLHTYKGQYYHKGGEQIGSFIGLFYTPISIGDNLYSKGSIGIFNRKFPNDVGQRLQFRIRVGYKFGRLGVEYSHQSNGFGVFGNLNPGVDNISIRYYL